MVENIPSIQISELELAKEVSIVLIRDCTQEVKDKVLAMFDSLIAELMVIQPKDKS